MAGAQLRGATTQEALEQLENAIDWYEQENPEK
jgi:c-di-AMP phosphodiesterase-like protein